MEYQKEQSQQKQRSTRKNIILASVGPSIFLSHICCSKKWVDICTPGGQMHSLQTKRAPSSFCDAIDANCKTQERIVNIVTRYERRRRKKNTQTHQTKQTIPSNVIGCHIFAMYSFCSALATFTHSV